MRNWTGAQLVVSLYSPLGAYSRSSLLIDYGSFFEGFFA